ncbi:MAG: hypothetical protein L6V93_08375 [Clostridiales bacterium]|nr:MAG: hypothetical protein L6V93_08375 [Clostridiales bacterium]
MTISSSYLKTKFTSYRQTLEFQKYHYFSEADTLNVKTDNLIELFRSSSALAFCRDNLVFAPPAENGLKYDKIKKNPRKIPCFPKHISRDIILSDAIRTSFSISCLNKNFFRLWASLNLNICPLFRILKTTLLRSIISAFLFLTKTITAT